MNRLGRIAAIDFGLRRMGIAISDAERRIASPLATYHRISAVADAQYFRRLVQREEVVQFVVGLPVHLSGNESQLSQQARQFGDWLQSTTKTPVTFFDERFSTAEADAILAESHLSPRQRRERRDMLAAQILLSAYLDSGERCDPTQPLDDPTM